MKYFNQYKILTHLDRVQHLKNNNIPPPVTVSFTLTDKCNNKCPRCMEVSGRCPLYPSMKNPTKRVLQIAGSKAKAITFSGGGEPLMHPEAVRTMVLAKSLGLEVGLVTNGSLLNKEKARQLTKVCTWIKISLDASTPKEYTSTHGMPPSAFHTVVENILYTAEHKKKCIVGVAYLVGENTKKGVLKAGAFWRDKGVNYLNFRPFQGDRFNYTELINKTKKYETDTFKIVWKDYKFSDWWNITYNKCHFQYLYPLVNCDGYVYPCCDMRGKKEYRFGNYYKDSLIDIFKRKRKPLRGFKDCIPNCIGHGCNKLLSDIFEKKVDGNFL